jgi:hypothetical protein
MESGGVMNAVARGANISVSLSRPGPGARVLLSREPTPPGPWRWAARLFEDCEAAVLRRDSGGGGREPEGERASCWGDFGEDRVDISGRFRSKDESRLGLNSEIDVLFLRGRGK